MTNSPPEPRRFQTWKEIAEYLEVSVRTAQTYAKESGLPVRRVPPRGQVFAFQHEIDQWQLEQSSVASLPESVETPAVEVAPEPVDVHTASKRRNRRIWIIAAAALLTASATIWWFVSRDEPTDWHYENRFLVVTGKSGRELWRYQTATVEEEQNQEPTGQRVIIADLFGDGRKEVLFAANEGANKLFRRLICFAPDGTALWKYSPGRQLLNSRNKTLDPPFTVNRIALFPEPGTKRQQIVFTAAHNITYPAEVGLLSPEGKLLKEYWHHGHLFNVISAELPGMQGYRILASGVNDNRNVDLATLVVLNPATMNGTARQPDGSPEFLNLPIAHEEKIIYFPRTRVSQEKEFNICRSFDLLGDKLRVIVSEGIILHDRPYIVYEGNLRLEWKHALLSDEWTQAARAMGVDPGIANYPELLEQLRQSIQVITPQN